MAPSPRRGPPSRGPQSSGPPRAPATAPPGGSDGAPARTRSVGGQFASPDHAPGALVWGLLVQARDPWILGGFLASGLCATLAVLALTGAGGLPAAARPLAVPSAVVVAAAWLLAYRQVDAVLGPARPPTPGALVDALRRLPHLLTVYGALGLLLVGTTLLSFETLGGHYAPRVAVALVAGVALLHASLATPALLLEGGSIAAALARSWRLARGRRITLAGLWTFLVLSVATLWLVSRKLLAAHGTAESVAVLGLAAGVVLGGFHLAAAGIYLASGARPDPAGGRSDGADGVGAAVP